MNDKIIINSISKIYFAIVSFFSFIFLILSVTYLLLSNGIHFNEVTISSIHINKLYIKWNKKLNISIDKLDISQTKNSTPFIFKANEIQKYLKNTSIIESLIESIIIQELNYKDFNASLRYVYKGKGELKVSSSNFNLDSIIHTNKNFINLEIVSFKEFSKKINFNGNIIIDKKLQELIFNTKVLLGTDVSLNIYADINIKQIRYAIASQKNIKSLKHLVSITGMPIGVKYWVDDAINMQSLSLKKAYGFIEWAKPQESLKNLYAYANLNKLHYTYNKNLDSIHTSNTDLEFKNGILFIKPHTATTYDFELDKSWLKIDFTKKEEMLTLHLLFNGFVDENLLHILNTFGIKLPFKQNSGSMATDLTLVINLINLDVDAQGTFFTKKSNFTYLGLDLDLFNTSVALNNFNIKITNMLAKYKKNISAYVDANLDVKHNIGTINFNVKKVNINNNLLVLDKDKPLIVNYDIANTGDFIKISSSQWILGTSRKVSIEALIIPFDYDKLFATIPTTQLTVDNIATLYTSGNISLKDFTTNLELDIVKFKRNDIELTQSNVLLNLSYKEEELLIFSTDLIKFDFTNYACSIYQPKFSMSKNNIIAKSSSFKIDGLFNSQLLFNYSLENSDGFLNLKRIKFKKEGLGSIFQNNKNIKFKLKKTKDKFSAYSKSLDTSIIISKKKWIITFNSLQRIEKHSKLLQKYQLDNGKVSIFKHKNDKNIAFLANIQYKHKLLSINDKLISKYIVNGIVDKNNNIIFNINSRLNIKFDNQINITGKDIGVNLNTIVELIKEINNYDKTSKSTTTNILINLSNSYIYYSEDRRAIADKISMQYYNNVVTAQLLHQGAEAGFQLKDDLFYLYGKGFNDKFMENLFALSEFKDGSFDFSLEGTFQEFNGILFINDTTIIEYKVLNNMLAFVNTIPALITFSLPGYDKNGLAVKSSYINFSFKDDIYTLSDIYLDSKEMDILGFGKASYKNNSIDLDLNLKTDLGSTMSKIPIVGYILFDGDSISTTLKVKGALDNPEVESMIAKDIIIAPLNIIKRTLLLPFKLFEKDEEDE